MSNLEKWINAILNEDAKGLSIGSVRTLQIIKHEFERLQKENETLKASQSQEIRPVEKDWTEIQPDGMIHVPDELDKIVNKVATQVRFHTISGKNEAETVCDIVYLCQKYFTSQSPIIPPDEKTGVYEGKTIGQIITDAMAFHELNPVTVERALDFPDGVILKLMNDEYYTNSIPVVLFRNLLVSLHIPFSVVEPAMIPTFNLLVSKETVDSIREKPMGYLLWENVESVKKYTQHLKELMQTGVYDSGEVFIACHENDPDICGSYTSNDGQSLCYVKQYRIK